MRGGAVATTPRCRSTTFTTPNFLHASFDRQCEVVVVACHFQKEQSMKVRLPRKLIDQFDRSCRAGLERWLRDAHQVNNNRLADLAPTCIRMLKEYPALAVASAHHYDLGPAPVMFWARYPLAEVAKRSRLRIGPDVPASALRIRTHGGRWPRMYVVTGT